MEGYYFHVFVMNIGSVFIKNTFDVKIVFGQNVFPFYDRVFKT